MTSDIDVGDDTRSPSRITDRRATESSTVQLEIAIDAPRDEVFDFLAVPEKVLRWMGLRGDMNPVPGGGFELQLGENDVAVGNYVDVLRPSRISWTWGWRGSATVPPGSSLVTFELHEVEGATVVQLTHGGLPDVDAAVEHTTGWTHFLPRLLVVVDGGDPDTDAT
jgi:uncharacterized protein YndB with AHSA1/START domain